MMRVLAFCALSLTGCGTMANLGRPSNGEPRELRVYGGVRHSVDNVGEAFAYPIGPVIPLSFADVALSAIADTITLPVTSTATLGRAISNGINDYYFPKPPPGEENAWRKYWFNEPAAVFSSDSVKADKAALIPEHPQPSPTQPTP